MSDFAQHLCTMRKSRGISQQQLADALGVSRSAVAMWERGAREPDMDMLEAIADVLNVPLAALFGNKEADEDSDLREIRETLRRRPEMRTLFSVSKNATASEIRQTISIIEALKRTSEHDEDA